MEGKLFAGIIAVAIIICVVAAYNLMAKEPLDQHDLTALTNAEYKRQSKLNKRKRK